MASYVMMLRYNRQEYIGWERPGAWGGFSVGSKVGLSKVCTTYGRLLEG